MFNLLFSYEGRINRAKWWLALLIYIIASIVLGALLTFVLALFFEAEVGSSLGAATIAFLAVYVVVLISAIAVGIKRLHDRNKSGWWLLLFMGVPIALGFVQLATGEESLAGFVISLITIAIGVWMLIELGCLRGTVGPNQYGPDPLPPGA